MNELKRDILIFIFVIFLTAFSIVMPIIMEHYNMPIINNPIFRASSIILTLLCIMYLLNVVKE